MIFLMVRIRFYKVMVKIFAALSILTTNEGNIDPIIICKDVLYDIMLNNRRDYT